MNIQQKLVLFYYDNKINIGYFDLIKSFSKITPLALNYHRKKIYKNGISLVN